MYTTPHPHPHMPMPATKIKLNGSYTQKDITGVSLLRGRFLGVRVKMTRKHTRFMSEYQKKIFVSPQVEILVMQLNIHFWTPEAIGVREKIF